MKNIEKEAAVSVSLFPSHFESSSKILDIPALKDW